MTPHNLYVLLSLVAKLLSQAIELLKGEDASRDRTCIALDEIWCKFASIRQELSSELGDPPCPSGVPESPLSCVEEALPGSALDPEVSAHTPAVSRLRMTPVTPRGSELYADSRPPVHLTPRQAQLLQALGSGKPATPGGPVPFKSYKEIADLIGIKTRAEFKDPKKAAKRRKRTLEMLICRLRELFGEKKLGRDLIETRRGEGARLTVPLEVDAPAGPDPDGSAPLAAS